MRTTRRTAALVAAAATAVLTLTACGAGSDPLHADTPTSDGGGSSTFMARTRSGRLRTINSPSDGGQRSIANGLEITYRKPR